MDGRTEADRALVRAAADEIIAERGRAGGRDYVTMARGTLAALDWLEGRTNRAPSTGEVGRPEDIHDEGPNYQPPLFRHELNWSEDWGSGYVRPPVEDLHYHGAVWSLLCWWRSVDGHVGLSISVPVLDERRRPIEEQHRRDAEAYYLGRSPSS